MDYRNYRGELPEAPEWLVKRLHLLRYIGALMVASPPLIGWLSILRIMQITFGWYLLASFSTFMGVVFVIIGLVFDTAIDRDG